MVTVHTTEAFLSQAGEQLILLIKEMSDFHQTPTLFACLNFILFSANFSVLKQYLRNLSSFISSCHVYILWSMLRNTCTNQRDPLWAVCFHFSRQLARAVSSVNPVKTTGRITSSQSLLICCPVLSLYECQTNIFDCNPSVRHTHTPNTHTHTHVIRETQFSSRQHRLHDGRVCFVRCAAATQLGLLAVSVSGSGSDHKAAEQTGAHDGWRPGGPLPQIHSLLL